MTVQRHNNMNMKICWQKWIRLNDVCIYVERKTWNISSQVKEFTSELKWMLCDTEKYEATSLLFFSIVTGCWRGVHELSGFHSISYKELRIQLKSTVHDVLSASEYCSESKISTCGYCSLCCRFWHNLMHLTEIMVQF